MADHEQLGVGIDLAYPRRHLAHRNVLCSGGVAALPFVVFPDVEKDDRLIERRRHVGHLGLPDFHFVHEVMLRGPVSIDTCQSAMWGYTQFPQVYPQARIGGSPV